MQNFPRLQSVFEAKAAPVETKPKAQPPANLVKAGSGGRLRIGWVLAHEELVGQVIEVRGWVKTTRVQGGGRFAFLEVNDGSTNLNLQIVLDSGMPEFERLAGTGISVACKGSITKSPGKEQSVEMKIQDPATHSFHVIGECNQAKYPLSKKEHSLEFLRELAHLRPRTELIGAVARIRNAMAFATHSFFQSRGFLYVHTPIITASDCEGAGEMFQVTTIMGSKVTDTPAQPDGKVDYSKDFFGRPAFLTVSGQLNVETYCCGLSDVYTFGPTFRAENSHTSRHLAEFWMIEPELAFAGIEEDMECAEGYLKYCIKFALDNNLDDLLFFEAKVEPGLVARLRNVLERPFARITYTEAVELVQKSEQTFSSVPKWGDDLQSEHERYISEQVVKGPVIVYNYPRTLKSFYMLVNEDQQTVQAMDILVPKIGEVIGGSVREHRYEKLEESIVFKGLNPKDYTWYQDLRSFGTVPHCGFGLGFERLIMMVSGVENIRDVIPFPRWPGHADF